MNKEFDAVLPNISFGASLQCVAVCTHTVDVCFTHCISRSKLHFGISSSGTSHQRMASAAQSSSQCSQQDDSAVFAQFPEMPLAHSKRHHHRAEPPAGDGNLPYCHPILSDLSRFTLSASHASRAVTLGTSQCCTARSASYVSSDASA